MSLLELQNYRLPYFSSSHSAKPQWHTQVRTDISNCFLFLTPTVTGACCQESYACCLRLIKNSCPKSLRVTAWINSRHIFIKTSGKWCCGLYYCDLDTFICHWNTWLHRQCIAYLTARCIRTDAHECARLFCWCKSRRSLEQGRTCLCSRGEYFVFCCIPRLYQLIFDHIFILAGSPCASKPRLWVKPYKCTWRATALATPDVKKT